MAKKKPVTKEELNELRGLYDTLTAHFQDLKKKAEASGATGSLTTRKHFEKSLAETAKKLSGLEARIRRGDMALFRRETKDLEAQQEANDPANDPTP